MTPKYLIALLEKSLELVPMKQFLALTVLFMAGCFGSLFEPVWGVLLYYTLAVLRPQYIWKWALPLEIRWSLVAGAIALMSVVLNLPRVINRARFNVVAVLMGCYGIALLGSVITAHDPLTSQQWAIEYAKILLMAGVATLVINKLWHIRAVAWMILVTLGYIAWEINYLYLFDGRLDIFHKGYGGLDNNGAGLMLAMGIPFAYAFGVSAKHWSLRVTSWVLGLLMLHAMLMSYSRGAMVSATVGAIWLLIHHRPRLNAGVIAAILVLAVSTMAGQEIRDRFFSSLNYSTDGSAQARVDSWAAAWQITWDHPVTGQGIRNSSEFIQNYGGDRHGRTIHSQYLQIAADSGIIATAAYILMLIAAMINLSRSRRLCESSTTSPLLANDTTTDSEFWQMHRIALSCQSSLIIFMFGGVFLSLEMVELPWLLVVLAGVMPGAIQSQADDRLADEGESTTDKPDPTLTPRSKPPHQTPGLGHVPALHMTKGTPS